ncbi:MAG TPA: outer membrane protein assembly factor BamA [Vicinamibacterales bacterium]
MQAASPASLRAQEARRVLITDVDFTGVSAVSERELAAALETRQSSVWPWGDRFYFSRSALRDDLARINAFYADRGYPNARVVTYDVELNEAEDEVRITFNIEEGEPVRIASVDAFGFEVLPQTARRLLRRQAGLRPGEIRTRTELERVRALAQNALQEEGYPYAQVSILEAPGPEPMTVAVTFAAEPGPAAVFGPVTIAGNTTVGEEVIRRQLAFGPGDPFKLSRVLESQRRLYALELFDYVNFSVPDPAKQLTEVPVTASITEGKHHRMQFGVGYGSEERARVSSRFRNVNFLGGGRTAGIEAQWSSLDRGVRLQFGEPYFFSPSYRLELQAQQWYSNEPAYDLVTRGGRATVRREIIRRDEYGRRRSATRASLSLIDEFERYTISEEALADPTFRDELIALGLDPDTREGRGTLVALGLDITHDTIRNPLDPRRGFLASLHLEQAGRVLGGDWRYFEVTFDARHYQPFRRGRVVLATKVRTGGISAAGVDPSDDDPLNITTPDVPFFKRYFLGGSTTLRGWGRYEVSPLNSEGYPIGGLGFLEAAAELRFPVSGSLTGVAFIDAGQVTADPWTRDLFELRYNAGAGLRYATPIGPVRFDFGYQLNPIEGLRINGELQRRRWRIHLSIGQAF